MKISNKELRNLLDAEQIIVDSNSTSLEIDTKYFYINASFNHMTNGFDLSAYLGNEKIEFTKEQENIICNLLGNAEDKEKELSNKYSFSNEDKEHALSLIF